MLALLLLAQAAAAPAAPPCPATSPLAQWEQARPGATLPLGMPVLVPAGPAPKLDPKQQGNVATADFRIVTAGTYTLAYGAKGWVDVLTASGARLDSSAHGHGNCGPAVKLVAFRLAPGSYRFSGDGVTGTNVHVALLSGDQTTGAPK